MNFCPNCGHNLSALLNNALNACDTDCHWQRYGNEWRCGEHRNIVYVHPNGYCDGCCCK